MRGGDGIEAREEDLDLYAGGNFGGGARGRGGGSAGGGRKDVEAVGTAPDVTAEMCDAAFWLQDGSDELLMSPDEIAAFNRSLFAVEGTHTRDLTAFDGTFDGVALAESCADFEPRAGLYLRGEPVPESYYEAVRENILGAPVTREMPYRFGFAVNRTIMKDLPYEDYLSDDPAYPEWDELTGTGILVNEPLVLLFPSADGKFMLVYSQTYTGWAPARGIAVCESKAEWESYLNPEDILVVTGEKLYLEPSADADLNEKLLTMGTVLPLEPQYAESVAYRLPWYNYVVELPARDAEGRFYRKRALVPANRDVSVGYLPYTQANVLTQAFKALGNRYGWGGMMNSQDCSAFAREVYRCFGFELARNASWQAQMPANVTVMTDMTAAEKAAVLDALPAGALLIMPGHEMLYLGAVDGRYYVINDASSFIFADGPVEAAKPRGVIINDLSARRENGKTWLENLSCAVVIR